MRSQVRRQTTQKQDMHLQPGSHVRHILGMRLIFHTPNHRAVRLPANIGGDSRTAHHFARLESTNAKGTKLWSRLITCPPSPPPATLLAKFSCSQRRSKRRSKETDDSERISSESEDQRSKYARINYKDWVAGREEMFSLYLQLCDRIFFRSRRFSKSHHVSRLCKGSIHESSNVKVSSFKREHKTAQTLTIVVGGFIACWLPFFCVYLAQPFLPTDTIPQLVMILLTWLGKWSC